MNEELGRECSGNFKVSADADIAIDPILLIFGLIIISILDI